MTNLTDTQIVASLARDIVQEVAPQELPMFRAQSTAYFVDPGASHAAKTKDDMLGFGVGAPADFMTPAILSISSIVVNFLFTTIKDSFETHSKEFIDEKVKSLFKKTEPTDKKEAAGAAEKAPAVKEAQPEKEEPGLELTPDQLHELRNLVYSQARQLKLSQTTARVLADSFIGKVAVKGL